MLPGSCCVKETTCFDISKMKCFDFFSFQNNFFLDVVVFLHNFNHLKLKWSWISCPQTASRCRCVWNPWWKAALMVQAVPWQRGHSTRDTAGGPGWPHLTGDKLLKGRNKPQVRTEKTEIKMCSQRAGQELLFSHCSPRKCRKSANPLHREKLFWAVQKNHGKEKPAEV